MAGLRKRPRFAAVIEQLISDLNRNLICGRFAKTVRPRACLLSAGVMLSWSQENIRLPSPRDMMSAVWQAGGWWSRTTTRKPTPRSVG